MKLTFDGADGDYTVEIDLASGSYEDRTIAVARAGLTELWRVENDSTDEIGCRALGGIHDGIWFELVLSPAPKMNFWGKGVLLRSDSGRV